MMNQDGQSHPYLEGTGKTGRSRAQIVSADFSAPRISLSAVDDDSSLPPHVVNLIRSPDYDEPRRPKPPVPRRYRKNRPVSRTDRERGFFRAPHIAFRC